MELFLIAFIVVILARTCIKYEKQIKDIDFEKQDIKAKISSYEAYIKELELEILNQKDTINALTKYYGK